MQHGPSKSKALGSRSISSVPRRNSRRLMSSRWSPNASTMPAPEASQPASFAYPKASVRQKMPAAKHLPAFEAQV
jgi:hypothetical protein